MKFSIWGAQKGKISSPGPEMDQTGLKILCSKPPIMMGYFNSNVLAQKITKKKEKKKTDFKVLFTIDFKLNFHQFSSFVFTFISFHIHHLTQP